MTLSPLNETRVCEKPGKIGLNFKKKANGQNLLKLK